MVNLGCASEASTVLCRVCQLTVGPQDTSPSHSSHEIQPPPMGAFTPHLPALLV